MMTRRVFLSACLIAPAVNNLVPKVAGGVIDSIWRYDIAGSAGCLAGRRKRLGAAFPGCLAI
jgi:hypothetical protein